MPRKTKLEDDPEQSKRFLDAAKKLGSDENGKVFELAMGAIVSPPKRPKRKGKVKT